MQFNISAREYAKKAKEALDIGVKKMGTEAKETQEMADSFFRLLAHKLKLDERTEPPTEQEVKDAIEQLKDVGRVSFFATISILPGGALSLIGLEVLAAKCGVKNFTFIPSAFRKNSEWHYPKGYVQDAEDEEKELGEGV
ncbi:MAG: hypothetical protein R3356_08740 [Eudoraea sp.]|nr:hypothetical protein [Eudoraea sp.]